jgi:hypothetical protein
MFRIFTYIYLNNYVADFAARILDLAENISLFIFNAKVAPQSNSFYIHSFRLEGLSEIPEIPLKHAHHILK